MCAIFLSILVWKVQCVAFFAFRTISYLHCYAFMVPDYAVCDPDGDIDGHESAAIPASSVSLRPQIYQFIPRKRTVRVSVP